MFCGEFSPFGKIFLQKLIFEIFLFKIIISFRIFLLKIKYSIYIPFLLKNRILFFKSIKVEKK